MEASSLDVHLPPEHPQASSALSLPSEILSHILSLSGHSLTGPRSFWLAHVCHQWRQVLLGHSEYWVDVVASSKFQQGTNTTFLTSILAQSSPRRIRLNEICLSPSITTLLAPSWHRVVFLEVKIHDQDHLQSLHAVLQHSQPSSLRELHITFHSVDHDPSEIDPAPLPHGALPALRHLFCPISYLPYIATHSLRHLEVSSWPGYPRQERAIFKLLSKLFDSLAICTELETLSIYGPVDRNLEIYPQFRNIHLHRLQKFFIRDGCPIRTTTILSTLKFGDTTTISVDCYSWDNTSGLREVVSHTRPVTDTARITIYDACLLMVELLKGGSPRLRVEFGLYIPFLNHDNRIFPENPNVTVLEWSSDGRPLSSGLDRDWEILLLSFPSLTRLSVSGVDVDALARALWAYRDPPPCPFLEEITVAWNAVDLKCEMVDRVERMERELARYLKIGDKMTSTLGAVGATPAARVGAIARVIEYALVRRAKCGQVRPLARVELSEYDLGGALSAEAMRAAEDELATLRTLVHGTVVFTKMTGTISTPSRTAARRPFFPDR